MDSKSNLYPPFEGAPPPQYSDLGGPSMIPAQTMPPHASTITVQQPNVYVQPPIQSNNLGRMPTMVTCPSCHTRQQTKVEHEPSSKTHLFALLICLVGGICCCCIPYCVDSCQSATHTCPSCGAFIGTYQN